MKYCYAGPLCWGAKVAQIGQQVSTMENCCEKGGYTWGHSNHTCLNCPGKADIDNPTDPTKPSFITQRKDLGFHTCMSYGTRVYRSFDGMEYIFDGGCEYTLMYDGIKTVNLKMYDCTDFSNCKKTLVFYLNSHTTVMASGENITVNNQPVTVSDVGTTRQTSKKNFFLIKLCFIFYLFK